MNWQQLTAQVESMMLDSASSLEEFADIISTDNWYEHPAWSGEMWWFGRGKGLIEMSFLQIRSMWDWMGLETTVITEALRVQIAAAVDELMRQEHVEDTQILEEVAA